MKKLLILCSFLVSLTAFSQIKVLQNEGLIEIGKDNAVGLYKNKKQNKYTINYQDLNAGNLNTFRSFSFLDLNNDVAELYKLITDSFIDMPNQPIKLELPNDIIELKFEKSLGQPVVQFVQYFNKNQKYVGKSQFLNRKQIDNIFGISKQTEKEWNKPVQVAKAEPASTTLEKLPNTTAGGTSTPKKTTTTKTKRK